MADAGRLAALLATVDSATPALTMVRVAPGVRLIGPPVDGVAALLVLRGAMVIEAGDEPERIVPQGSLVLVSGGGARLAAAVVAVTTVVEARHCLTPRDGWLVADASRGQPPALVVAAGRIAGSGAMPSSATIVVPPPGDPVGRAIVAQIGAEYDRGAAGLPALAAALMNACVIQGLQRATAAQPQVVLPPAQRGLIARAVAAVRARPAEAHTVDTLAAVAGMSRSTFIRHFKRTLSVAPSEYVQQVRLEEARTMLESTELPVKTIAARTGFASRSHFSRMFRGAFGHDPSGYREHVRDAN